MRRLEWMRFNRYLYIYWKLQAVIIVLGLSSIPLSLINPYLTKLVIDKAYGNKDLKLFFTLAIIAGAVFIISGLINLYSGYLSKRINQLVQFDLARDFFRHLQYLPISFFNSSSTGENIYRLSSDVSVVSQFVCRTIPDMIEFFPRLLFTMAIIFYLNPKMAALTLLLVPVSYIHPYFFGNRLKEITRKNRQRAQSVLKNMQEVFSHIHLIKAFGRQEHEISIFEANLSKSMQIELKNSKVSAISGFSNSILSKTLGGIISLYGGFLVIKGALTLGSLMAIMIYMRQFMVHLESLGGMYQSIKINSVSRAKLSEILDRKTVKDSDDAVYYTIQEAGVEFKDITFGYDKARPVLNGVSFKLKPASKAALVGLSGSGKTTILSFILRLYEPDKGSVLIDGINTNRIKFNSLMPQIGVALQDPFLWNDTIANNISYAAQRPSREDIINSAKIAQAHDFIMKLPAKYDSVMGEMACKLSEGQKQRIAIARAVIKKPRILILDEAMSSLDSKTEDRVIDNIMYELSGSTVIVVSHRLSTVKKMDMVYFLKDPSTIISGRHEELLNQNPAYRELFASQIDEAYSETTV